MRAVLLDRDGVINENSEDYVTSWPAFRFLPRALDALAGFSRLGVRLAIVTNQSAVGRGLMTQAALHDVHARMLSACEAAGARVDSIYVCPHAPQRLCVCRKPRPTLLRIALTMLGATPEQSVFIGDSPEDLGAARAAGVRFVLVRTGRGEATLRALSSEARPLFVADDLWDAYQTIAAQRATVIARAA